MEAGAAFLLLVLVVLIAAAAAVVWAIASKLRRRKLDRDEDKIDRDMLTPDEATSGFVDGNGAGERRPEHSRVASEQHSRSIPRR